MYIYTIFYKRDGFFSNEVITLKNIMVELIEFINHIEKIEGNIESYHVSIKKIIPMSNNKLILKKIKLSILKPFIFLEHDIVDTEEFILSYLKNVTLSINQMVKDFKGDKKCKIK